MIRYRQTLRYTLLSAAATLPFLSLIQTARAADESAPGGLEQIVVTATKREEVLSKVPISVTAVTEADLRENGIKGIADLDGSVPGLHLLSVNVGGGVNYQIRGVSSQVGAGTVGVYIDDSAIQNRNSKFSANATPPLFDIERVEVLRGPQGTLFGSSSEGGTVRFITPQPSLSQWSGRATADMSFIHSGGQGEDLGVATGGPIIDDKLGMRASVFVSHTAGWIDQVSRVTGAVVSPNTNQGDTVAARLAFVLQASDKFSISPSLYYSRIHQDDWPAYYQQLGQFNNGEATRQPSTDIFYLPTLKLNYDFDGFSVTSITSYFNRSYHRTDDVSEIVSDFYSIVAGNPNFLIPNGPGYQSLIAPQHQTVLQRSWTEEARASSNNPNARLAWTIGVYYNHADEPTSQFTTASAPDNAANGPPIVLLEPGNVLGISNNDTIDQQISGFVDLTYAVTGALKVNAGVRVGQEKVTTSSSGNGFVNGGPTNVLPQTATQTPVDPKFGISYQITDEDLIYVSGARGYRPGGANGPVNTVTCARDLALSGEVPGTYGSDHVWSYEVGTKDRFFNNRLSVNGSVYYIKWSDIQTALTLPSCGSTFTTNLGNSTSKGGELEVQALLTDSFHIGGTAGYTHATLDQNVFGRPNPNTGVSALLGGAGDPNILTPKWTASANARYEFPLAADVKGYIRGEYSYFGSYVRTPGPETTLYNPTLYSGSGFDTVTLRAGAVWNNVDVSLFATNLFNNNAVTYKVVGALLTQRVILNSTLQPRTLGVTASYKW